MKWVHSLVKGPFFIWVFFIFNILLCSILGEWYGAVNLPYRGRELVCCDYLGSLFIINIADKAGYFFNTTFHTSHNIIDKDYILANFRELFAVFEYNKDLYLIGMHNVYKKKYFAAFELFLII